MSPFVRLSGIAAVCVLVLTCTSSALGGTTPIEKNIRLTYGGFIDKGNETQVVNAVCALDENRTVLNCDVYNGLPTWKITAVIVRVSWSPYGQSNVRNIQQRVVIDPYTTETTQLKLGLRIPDDTILLGHPMTHWSWQIVGAKGISLR